MSWKLKTTCSSLMSALQGNYIVFISVSCHNPPQNREFIRLNVLGIELAYRSRRSLEPNLHLCPHKLRVLSRFLRLFWHPQSIQKRQKKRTNAFFHPHCFCNQIFRGVLCASLLLSVEVARVITSPFTFFSCRGYYSVCLLASRRFTNVCWWRHQCSWETFLIFVPTKICTICSPKWDALDRRLFVDHVTMIRCTTGLFKWKPWKKHTEL